MKHLAREEVTLYLFPDVMLHAPNYRDLVKGDYGQDNYTNLHVSFGLYALRGGGGGWSLCVRMDSDLPSVINT